MVRTALETKNIGSSLEKVIKLKHALKTANLLRKCLIFTLRPWNCYFLSYIFIVLEVQSPIALTPRHIM